MLVKTLKVLSASLCCIAILVNSGCSNCCRGTKVTTVVEKKPCPPPAAPCVTEGPCDRPAGEMSAELPPNARPGECYAKVYIPPTFKTVTERILVKDATEQIEIIPAEYGWVEERVCVKEASKRLVEVPAQFKNEDVTVMVEAAHTDWQVTKSDNCKIPDDPNKKATKTVFCLVNHPAQHETIPTVRQVCGPTVREEIIPAEYETIRRQKVVRPATTRRVCIPAEYQTVQKTVKVCDGRMAWQRVICETPLEEESITSNTPRVIRVD